MKRDNAKNHKVEITKMITDPELVSEIAFQLKKSPEEVRGLMSIIIEAMRKMLDLNGAVCIRRLGRIFLKQRKRQRMRNFEGKIIDMPTTLMIRFFPAQSLRSFINVKIKKDREAKLREK